MAPTTNFGGGNRGRKGEEKKKRMKRMRDSIKRNDIYHWSANLLKNLINLG